jgi:hypothetical protein
VAIDPGDNNALNSTRLNVFHQLLQGRPVEITARRFALRMQRVEILIEPLLCELYVCRWHIGPEGLL